MKPYVLEGDRGKFCGFLKSFVNAVFSFLGAEVIAVAAWSVSFSLRSLAFLLTFSDR